MDIILNVPEGVEAAAQLRAKRSGKSVEREVKDLFYKFAPLIADMTLTYKDIAQLENMHHQSIRRLASAGAFGKLVRRNVHEVRVPIEGYLKWKRGRAR